ncbi:hypothetical protein [Halobacillus litoralis]|uniref:hypothetical protein n=1 Tax=Halobacillus litoralis TaxID=45668 RepID=UPI002493BA1C|nr:hypothetical protein [Halobacillus litoralis]
MKHRISHDQMDKTLKQLEDDYIKAVKDNKNTTIDGFVEQFLYDSWNYNYENLELIQAVLRKYAQGDISKTIFQGAFNEMTDHLQGKLRELDPDQLYPLVHQPIGASILVSCVDGMIIQYFTNVYSIEDLNEMTPQIKRMLLNALGTNES